MDRILSISVFIIVSLFVLPSLAQPKKEVACPTCFHVEYKTRNLPSLVKTLLERMLSRLHLSNPECKSNKVAPETCNKPLIPFLMENKCTSAKIYMKAVGLKSIFPDAEVDVSVVIRRCKSVLSSTADKCVNLNEIGAAEKAVLTKNIKQIESQWNKVTYSGNVCTKTP